MPHSRLSTFDKVRDRSAPQPSDCITAKVRFKKQRQAKRAAAELARRDNPRRRNMMRPYHCPACDGWHLTGKPQLPAHMLERPGPLT